MSTVLLDHESRPAAARPTKSARRRWAVIAVLPAVMFATAAPAQTPAAWPTALISSIRTEGDRTWLVFHDAACTAGNCQPGWLTCRPSGSPRFELFGLSGREIGDWFLRDAGQNAIEAPRLVVSFDGVEAIYQVERIVLDEDNGLNNVDGKTNSQFVNQFAAATEIRFATPGREFVLPSTPADLANRATFAAACRGG